MTDLRVPSPATLKLASNGLSSVTADASRLNSQDNLKAAGERFEAIFTKMMLGSMRKAKLSDSLFESQALDQFRDMQDDRLAQNMASHAPIGIGKAMTEFLAKANAPAQQPSAPGAQGDVK